MTYNSSPLLATKLFVVRPQGNYIVRERLASITDEIGKRRLTLISAPAGFGKTTMLSEWIARKNYPTAWVSLDRGDDDLARFLEYLIAALQTVHPQVGNNVRQALQLNPLPAIETLLTSLINELSTLTGDLLLVFDDYHVIVSPHIHEALIFLLDHLPVQMHLALTSRIDPPIPLARYRVRGELLEIRAADLRFSREEATHFFQALMSPEMSQQQLDALCEKTEGWVAGLQMAAISLEGRSDIDSFITAFTGADRYVLDYLLEEVLNRQPEQIQRLLLDLSILDRFNGPLCEAVAGCEEGGEILERLERANLFLIPLDNRREWYRYHRLFADLLHHRLRQQRPESIPELHRRASNWYERQGLIDDAIQHAEASRDHELMARLLDENWRLVVDSSQSENSSSLNQTDSLPAAIVEANPRLCLLQAWNLVYPDRRLDEVERLLDIVDREIEGWKDKDDYVEMIAQAACLRSAVARDRGDFVTAIEQGERARKLLPERSGESIHFDQSLGLLLKILGASYSFAGNTRKAKELSQEAIRFDRGGGNRYALLVSLGNLGRQCTIQGHLNEGDRCREEMLALGALDDPFAGIGPNIVYLLEARIQYERSQFDQARDAALEGIRICDRREVNLLVDLHRQLALIYDAMGQREAACRTIEEIERIPLPEYERRLETIPQTLRAQLAVREGDLETAGQWASRFFGDTAASLPERTYFLLKWEQLLYSRILIAQKKIDEALALLTELNIEFERSDVPRLLVESLVVTAMGYQAKGENERAIDAITLALRLGAPDGYTRVFAYEGKGMIRLLAHFQKGRAAASLKVPADYFKKVMEECGLGLSEDSESPLKEINGHLTLGMTSLTGREIEILQLMSLGYSNQKIADKLYVSVNTIKTHASNLFDKLNARNRVDALLRAREAKIL